MDGPAQLPGVEGGAVGPGGGELWCRYRVLPRVSPRWTGMETPSAGDGAAAREEVGGARAPIPPDGSPEPRHGPPPGDGDRHGRVREGRQLSECDRADRDLADPAGNATAGHHRH